MANTNSDQRANEVVEPVVSNATQDQRGRLRLLRATYTATTADGVGDTITLGTLPKGARVDQIRCFSSIDASADAVDIGHAGDDDFWCDTVALPAATTIELGAIAADRGVGLKSAWDAAASNPVLTEERQVIVTITTGTLAAGQLEFSIYYTVD